MAPESFQRKLVDEAEISNKVSVPQKCGCGDLLLAAIENELLKMK
jgi:hypothetical protein